MALKDYADLLPEDKREAYKAEVDKAIFIESKEDAERVANTNQYLKAVSQSIIDKRFQDREEKFKKDELPKLLEEERKKGQKSELELKLDEEVKRREKLERDIAVERQKTRALKIATEKGVPAELIDGYIGETEEETDERLGKLFKVVLPWKESAVNAERERFGTQPNPQGGDGADKGTMSRNEFESLPAGKKMEVARTTKIVDNPAL